MQIALCDAGEEILKAGSRFRRGGDDETPVCHCEVYLGLLPKLDFDRKRLWNAYGQTMSPSLDLRAHGPFLSASPYGSTKKIPLLRPDVKILWRLGITSRLRWPLLYS